MRTVKFTKDFATKKKGETGEYDSMLASIMVHQKKVAKYVKTDEEKTLKDKILGSIIG